MIFMVYFFIFFLLLKFIFWFSGPSKKEKACFGAEKEKDESVISLLDLPELALDSILERLEPKTLSNMSCVCSYIREKCVSDRIWERHMNEKWGKLIGEAARKQWQCHIADTKKSTLFSTKKWKIFLSYGSRLFLFYREKLGNESKFSPLQEDSIMAWYLALETGKFWFPAQVYNREVQNGNIGFLLSCYDAELGYDFRTNSFKARYLPQGRSTVEYNVEWDRVRRTTVDTPCRSLHTSGCLYDMAPGDHIEIQWRRKKDFAYGWWYGVVGHHEYCDAIQTCCQCRNSDTLILEFKQYKTGSQWRSIEINRKEHTEIGNETDGFYGGIRKVNREDEISVWKRFWSTQVLE